MGLSPASPVPTPAFRAKPRIFAGIFVGATRLMGGVSAPVIRNRML